MSDVEIRTYPDVCSLSSQGECCWYLEWKIKEEPEQNESIYGYQVNGYSQADSSSHVLQNRNLFALNCDPWWVSQSMGQVCGVSGNQNMCWARWSLPRIIPALGKWISRNSCNHLNCRFAILKVLDVWNNMPISNMDLSASRQRGYGQLFLFALSSAKYLSVTTHSVPETMSGLYELQYVVKGRTSRQQG